MFVQKFEDIKGEFFPSGRLIKVLVGPENKIKANNFVMGTVKINPYGSIPRHQHPNEEIYIILKGKGIMKMGEEREEVQGNSVVYIPSNQEHCLENRNNETLEMIFVYSPATIVDHWEKERTGFGKNK